MSTLAKVLLAIGAVIVVLGLLVALLVWGVLGATSGPVKASDAFFAATARRGPAASYDLASPSFRSVVPETQWEAYARQYGLSGYTGASWSSRSVTNNVATLRGSLKLAGGGALPATVQLTEGGAGWQVLHLRLADGGVSSGSAGTMATAPAASDDDMQTIAASSDTDATGSDATPTTTLSNPSADRPDTSANTSTPPVISGARVASLCRAVLAQQAQATFDTIECPDSLAAKPGATTACMVSKGGQSALMTARLETFEPTTQHFTFKCKVADHPLS